MMLRQFSRLSTTALVLGAGLALCGCLGPTYGTGQSQGEQLFNDLDGMLTLGSSNKQNIDYTPRAELVKPKQIGALPAPQEKVDAARDPSWPESPEQRSARIKAAADAEAAGTDGALPMRTMMADKEGIDAEQLAANTRGGAAGDNGRGSTTLSVDEMKNGGTAFRERLKESKQGSPTQRKYLSEPPIAYRQPSSAAPVGDPGLDEAVKEARYKKDEGFGSKIRSLLPF